MRAGQPPYPLKFLSALLLALMLFGSSITMAVARGQAQGGMVVTLCSAKGVETLVVDAQGNPVPAPHICPYCIIGVAVLPDIGTQLLVVMRQALPLDPPSWQALADIPQRESLPEARAPPRSV